MSYRCASLAGDPPLSHRGIKILRFCGPPILGPCKDGVLRPVRHAQRIAPTHAKRHIFADRGHLGIIRAEPLKSIIILGAPVCKAFQRPELALISLIDHVITPLSVCCFPALSRGAGGCNLFCGEVYRLPLDLCQHPGGLAAIVGDGCAL